MLRVLFHAQRPARPQALRLLSSESGRLGRLMSGDVAKARAQGGAMLNAVLFRCGAVPSHLAAAGSSQGAVGNAVHGPEPTAHWSAPRVDALSRWTKHVEPSVNTALARKPRVIQKYDELAWINTGLTTDELQQRLLALTDAQCATVTKCVVV